MVSPPPARPGLGIREKALEIRASTPATQREDWAWASLQRCRDIGACSGQGFDLGFQGFEFKGLRVSGQGGDTDTDICTQKDRSKDTHRDALADMCGC
eukprot:1468090-Rhodomonas_salina.1